MPKKNNPLALSSMNMFIKIQGFTFGIENGRELIGFIIPILQPRV
jgi:hypothetical protein